MKYPLHSYKFDLEFFYNDDNHVECQSANRVSGLRSQSPHSNQGDNATNTQGPTGKEIVGIDFRGNRTPNPKQERRDKPLDLFKSSGSCVNRTIEQKKKKLNK